MAGAPSPSAPPAPAATGQGPDLQVGPRPERPLPRFGGGSALPSGDPEDDAVTLDGVAVLLLGVGAAGPGADGAVELGAGAAGVEAATGLDLARICADAPWRAAAGSVLPVHGAALPGGTRLVLLGTGKGTARDLRRAGAALARASRGCELVATTAVAALEPALVGAFTEGVLLGAWTPPRSGVEEGPEPAVEHVKLLGITGRPTVRLSPDDEPATEPAWTGYDVAKAWSGAETAATATWRVRDLAATPSSTKTPAWVAQQAQALCAGRPGLTVTVLDEEDLAQRRAGGLLAVGAASRHPPCLVRVDWTPSGPAPVAEGRAVLVGKGITYDTGGLALKPRESMVAMKTDMAGAAVVLATVVAAAEADLRRPVTALLPLAENALGAASYRPGDVIRVLDGTTVEVDNPDAEGRLVLADALALADAELDPALLVDVATLTGAATLGLGRQHAALFTEDDALAAALAEAGEATGERVWRMPLVEEYRASLDSDVADLRHVPSSPAPGAGSVTAALFLREFAGQRRWAHLDIAGVGRSEKESHEVPRGATGWGARLLLRLLEDLA
ncbi:leucyl aminopeptidase family protein [Quadrisphaera oryzae]|uniref:leucyl aminopeptidase family protein n=1 Tax=Quadrisphaera TaxID=317661 RepID=UPI001C945DCC